jgi:hypothetical protein
MILQHFEKSPDEHLDYDVVFAKWLDGDDTISAATAEIAGGTATVSLVEFDSQTVKVWLDGGVAGETNKITVTDDDDGRTN